MCKHTAVNEVEAELKKPENKGVVASVNTETGEVLTFMAPKPYWETKNDAGDTGTLTASEVTALETERDQLIAALPQLSKAERSKNQTKIAVIESTLRRARATDEDLRRSAEREAERPVQRYGQPGNTQQAVNWSAMDMATQTDLIQAAVKELRRVGAA
jgi:hypothetical protein